MRRTAHASPRRLGLLGLVVLLVASSVIAGPAAQAAPGAVRVAAQQPWIGAPGVSEATSALMARERDVQAAAGPTTAPGTSLELQQPDRSGLPQDPASPARPAGAATSPRIARSGAPAAAQTPSTSFTGATLTDTSAFPPDAMGAVGPTQYIVAVNGRVRSFAKSTGTADGVLDLSMDAFFASVRNGVRTSDPRIRYDRSTDKWYVAIINVALPNRVLLAVSDTGTVTGSSTWTFFYFQQNLVTPVGDATCLADYPTLGIDAAALYIGVNQFCGADLSSATFTSTAGFVVRKTSVQGVGPIVVTAFRGMVASSLAEGPYSPQGVDNPAPSSNEGYFIGVSNVAFGRLVLRRITDPGGTPTISGNVLVSVATTQNPILANHLGNTGGVSGRLDALDDRLMNAVYRNGHLWTIHNIGVDNTGSASGTVTRNGTRWYDLIGIPTGSAPAVNQSGTVFDSTAPNDTDQLSYFMGSIMVSGQGHVATGGTVAGTNHYADAYQAGRLATDTPGTMSAPTAYTASTFAYNPAGDPGGPGGRRWGDYSSTTLDPDDDMTMWTIQEFTAAQDVYGLRVVKLLAPPPATPSSLSPSSVPYGQPAVNVTITGTSTSGSGFFDPGAGFAKRLEVAFGGGVTVQSVSYTDPTHLTATISTVGATLGSHAVTVTNPDGQTSTVSGLLTITSPGPATHLTVSGPATATAGSSFGATVTAMDASNAVAADYTGTVHLTASSPGTLPADYTFGSGDNGRHVLPVTLTEAGSHTVTATDTVSSSITGTSAPIMVSISGGGGGGGGGPPPAPEDQVTRLGGTDRIATAIAVSQATFVDLGTPAQPGSSQVAIPTRRALAAVLTRSDSFADALAGTPLAVARSAPLLLTPGSSLDARVLNEINRVVAPGSTVYLLGGTAALSGDLEAQVRSAGYAVVRYAGTDRYETAVAIASGGLPDATRALLATGLNFPDALSGGAAAAAQNGVVLLTADGIMPAATKAYLDAHPAVVQYALGGPASAAAPQAIRLVGEDRYDTSRLVAERLFGTPSVVGLASGVTFPDALSGGVKMGFALGPLLLTDPSVIPGGVRFYVAARRSSITAALVFGGVDAVSSVVVSDLQTAISSG